VCFKKASSAFDDPARLTTEGLNYSIDEARYFCFGKVGEKILTVRFTMRGDAIRIIGAGYWREGKRKYEQNNN
jgi:uncharacterized DUF497 family protein